VAAIGRWSGVGEKESRPSRASGKMRLALTKVKKKPVLARKKAFFRNEMQKNDYRPQKTAGFCSKSRFCYNSSQPIAESHIPVSM
jgi:hypothetical protein